MCSNAAKVSFLLTTETCRKPISLSTLDRIHMETTKSLVYRLPADVKITHSESALWCSELCADIFRDVAFSVAHAALSLILLLPGKSTYSGNSLDALDATQIKYQVTRLAQKSPAIPTKLNNGLTDMVLREKNP